MRIQVELTVEKLTKVLEEMLKRSKESFEKKENFTSFVLKGGIYNPLNCETGRRRNEYFLRIQQTNENNYVDIPKSCFKELSDFLTKELEGEK